MESPEGVRRIVVGVDGSPSSVRALEWAIGEADRAGAVVDAVLVFDIGVGWTDIAFDVDAGIVERATERAEKTLQEALASVAAPADSAVLINHSVVPGDPADVLVRVAANADLLVVGTRGRGGFAGLLLGSVSQRCAERSRCPVAIVPSWGKHEQEGGRS